MFLLKQPVVRDTTVFTRLPDQFRMKDTRSAWADANRGGTCIDSFLEAPVFDAAGNLYVSDIPFGRIFRITRAGEWELIVQYDGEPNGMKFFSASEILIADYKNGLMLLDLHRGDVRPYLARRNTEQFKGVNDLVFDSRSNLYFTDQGQTGMHDATGRVFRLSAQGKLDALLCNAPSPNGLVLSPDESVLFVAMTRGNCVWRLPLQADGSVGKVGQFFTSYGPSGPDGLAMDQSGRLLVANPGLGWTWVLNSRAEPVEILRSTAGASLTNLAFDPVRRTEVFFTESATGTILQATMDTPGVPLFYRAFVKEERTNLAG